MSWLEEQVNGMREMKLWTLYNFKNKELRKVRKILLDSYQKNVMWDQKYSFCGNILDALVIGIIVYGEDKIIFRNQVSKDSYIFELNQTSNIQVSRG